MKKMSIKLGSTWINHPLTFQAATDDGLTTPKMNPLAAMGPKFLFNSTKKTRCQQVATAAPNTCNVMKVSTQAVTFYKRVTIYNESDTSPSHAQASWPSYTFKAPSTAKNAMPESRRTHLKIQRGPTLTDVRMSSWPGPVWWISISPMNNQ